MIDFHSHVLPKMDDGAKSVEVAVAMLEESKRQGVTTVVCTPHYYGKSRSPEQFIEKRKEAYARLAPHIPEGITLRLGAEVYFTADMVVPFEDLAVLAIEGTRYIMLELPFTPTYPERLFERLETFVAESGCIPIIAHVDRYPAVLKKPAILKRLTEMGCLLQMNAEALEVKGVKSFALAALKKGLISALGTDMHNMSDRPPNMKIYSIALQLHGLPIELAQKILDTEYAILSDRPVQTTEGKLRRIFGKYF